MAGSAHAPKTGPSYSAGKGLNSVGTNPGFAKGAAKSTETSRTGNKGAKPEGSGSNNGGRSK